MANIILLQKGDLKKSDFTNDNSNNKEGIGVRLSSDRGNLLQQRNNGLYYGIEAPPDTANLYVSTTMGDDANAGTRAAPLKTIREAVTRNTVGTQHTIHLYEEDTFDIHGSWGAIATGRVHTIRPYGPAFDAAVAASPRGSIQYLRSQQIKRPTVRFVPDGQVPNGAEFAEATVFTSTSAPITNAYSLTGVVIDLTAQADLDFTVSNRALYGSHITTPSITFIGCEFKLGDHFFMVQAAQVCNVVLDFCYFDTSVGTKFLNMTRRGNVNLTVEIINPNEGAVIPGSTGLTYSRTTPRNQIGALLHGSVNRQSVSSANVFTRDEIF